VCQLFSKRDGGVPTHKMCLRHKENISEKICVRDSSREGDSSYENLKWPIFYFQIGKLPKGCKVRFVADALRSETKTKEFSIIFRTLGLNAPDGKPCFKVYHPLKNTWPLSGPLLKSINTIGDRYLPCLVQGCGTTVFR
jgi:hypothetical protein